MRSCPPALMRPLLDQSDYEFVSRARRLTNYRRKFWILARFAEISQTQLLQLRRLISS